MQKEERVIVELATMTTFTLLSNNLTDEEVEKEVERAKQYYADDFKRTKELAEKYPNDTLWQDRLKAETKLKRECVVMTLTEYLKAEREFLLSKELKEITEEEYQEMLNVLPPIKWVTIDDVEMFCMCEMYTGTYSSQYAHDRRADKYYTKLVDVTDTSTWINNILRAE